MRRAASLAALLVASGCFVGLAKLEPFQCAVETGTCPAGFYCYEGSCHSGSGPADAASTSGDPDAGTLPPDGGVSADADLGPEWALWRVPPDAPLDYTVSDAGIVTDNVTGLLWQRTPDSQACTWDEAKTRCQNLVLGGVRGWTLPTEIELLSLVDASHTAPAINEAAFPATPSACFWSASVYVGSKNSSWYVAFNVGDAMSFDRGNPCHARCVVRPTSSPGAHYSFPTPDTVFDHETGLTWQRTAPTRDYKQSEALDYCRVLPLGNFGSGWKLPTKKQLETLVNRQLPAWSSITIDLEAFPGEANKQYWTSTPYADEPTTKSWLVGFFGGSSTFAANDFIEVRARCVHE